MASYVTIQDWMLDLGLTSSELMAYAVICSYWEQQKWFQGSASYLGWWMGTKRKATVLDALTKLVEKGLVLKRERLDGGIRRCDYRPVRQPVRKEYRTGTESVPHNTIDIPMDNKEIKNKERFSHESTDDFIKNIQ
jgi:hypothetical protein